MQLNQRQNAILELLQEKKRLNLKDLARQFGVSEMTVRRDFRLLEKNNMIAQVHGGAINAQKISFELFLGEKANQNSEAKTEIAKNALQYLHPGDTLFLDTGSTVFQVTHFLNDIPNLTVATPSLAIASNLFYSKNVKLIVPGGTVRPWSPDLVGTLAEKNIRELHFKKAFFGADGIDPANGFFCSDLQVTNIMRAAISSSDQKIVLADSSKIGTRSLVKYADFEEIDLLITDNRSPEKLKAVRNSIKTVCVSVEKKEK